MFARTYCSGFKNVFSIYYVLDSLRPKGYYKDTDENSVTISQPTKFMEFCQLEVILRSEEYVLMQDFL